MTLHFSNWLPDTAFVSPQLEHTIAAAIERWAGRWFGSRFPTHSTTSHSGRGPRMALEEQWCALADGVWLQWSEAIRLSYAALSLDLELKGRALSKDDTELMLLLTERMSAELGSDLAELLQCSSSHSLDESPAKAMYLTWGGVRGQPSLSLAIASRSLVGLRRRQCHQWQPKAAGEVRLSQVLGNELVAVEVNLGSAKISAIELRDIGLGDVVVLDRSAGDLVELRREDSFQALVQCSLKQDEGKLQLIVKQD